MFLAIVLVLVHALAAQSLSDVDALCKGKNINLKTYSQIKQLSEAVDGSSCSPLAKNAITELASLIEFTQGDLCSGHSIDYIRFFYLKYLDTSDNSRNGKLPKELTRFALAYGMEVSNLCKKNMVHVLTERGSSLLADEDHQLLERLISDESPIAKILEGMSEPGEVVVPGDLAPLLRGKDAKPNVGESEKLFIQAATGSYFGGLQAACRQRIEPVYGPLMLPLVQLANMGFNYKDEPLKCDLECTSVQREVARWSRIVFVCESFKSIHIVESQEDQEAGEGSGGKLVRIVTKEEAAALEGGAKSENEPDMVAGDEPQVDFGKVTLFSDVIYDKDNKLMAKALGSFKTDRTEEENIKKRMLDRGFSVIMDELKRGNVGLVISAPFKALVRRIKNNDVGNLKPNEGMVKILDDLVSRDSNPDKAVSGLDPEIWAKYVIGVPLGLLLVSAFGALIFVIVMAFIG